MFILSNNFLVTAYSIIDCKGMRIASFISLDVMNGMNGGLFIKKKYSHVELSKRSIARLSAADNMMERFIDTGLSCKNLPHIYPPKIAEIVNPTKKVP